MALQRRTIYLGIALAALIFHPGVYAQGSKVAAKTASKVLGLIEKWGSRLEGEGAKLTEKELRQAKTIRIPEEEASRARGSRTWRPGSGTSDVEGKQIAGVSWSFLGVPYNGGLFTVGNQLVLRVTYYSPVTGSTVVDQQMRVGYDQNCDKLLVGYNPVYANTNRPVPTYMPDSFCFKQISPNDVAVFTCTPQGCATVYIQTP